MDEEKEAKKWIFGILNLPIPEEPLEDVLNDGIVLCNLVNRLSETTDSIYPSKKNQTFSKLENIVYFTEFARRSGVPDEENFQTSDLFYKKNMRQVICCIYSLSRNLRKNKYKNIASLGPELK